jgi:pimeloyl-ACP methyl ester carboxylesterase
VQSLVFVPGLLCDELLWSHQVRHLRDLADCRVADVTGADTIDGLARAVLAQAPPRFALAGLSMAIMAMAPERVERLALISTSARADTAEQTARRRRLIAVAESGRFAEVTPLLLPALLHPDRVSEPGLVAQMSAMAANVGLAGFLRQVNAVIGRPDRLPDLAHYRLPSVVIVGREDAVTTLDMGQEMADRIPNSRFAVIEECGHISTLERPQAVTALMRQWLLYPPAG